MSRIPIRLRITLVFCLVMALVLAGIGAFVYTRLDSDLSDSIDTALRARAAELRAAAAVSERPIVTEPGAGLVEQDESLAQLLTPEGRVLDSTAQVADSPVLSPEQLARAAEGTVLVDVDSLPGLEARVRVLAIPVTTTSGAPAIAVVGSSLDDRDEALSSLLGLLLIGGPIALLLTGAAVYVLVGRTLRPVEGMRSRAAAISAADRGERLPIPAADDELRRLGVTLNEMLDRLAAGLERERRFVDDASHELRTPLALHKTELELALRLGEGEHELRSAIASSIEEVDRLIGLAEALLVFARAGDDGLELQLEEVEAGELLRTIAGRFSARAAGAGRSVEVEAHGVLRLRADRLRAEQALTGLVDNALRHGAGTVVLGARPAGGLVELHVRDQGEIDSNVADRAFDRFTRGDPSRGGGGFGLGLAIVAAIADAHRGEVGIEGGVGRRTDVWIALPAVQPV